MGEMTIQTIEDVQFASETFVIVYSIGVSVLYERLCSSIISLFIKAFYN